MAEEKVMLSVRIRPELRRLLRVEAASTGVTVESLIERAVEDMFAREQGFQPVLAGPDHGSNRGEPAGPLIGKATGATKPAVEVALPTGPARTVGCWDHRDNPKSWCRNCEAEAMKGNT